MRLVWAFVLVSLVAGCGETENNGDADGGGHELPDGFIQTGCNGPSDCDDSNPCTTDTCMPGLHMCAHAVVNCPGDSCNDGVCSPSSGKCGLNPANESMTCLTSQNDPGTCVAGHCDAVPKCETRNSSVQLGCQDKTTDEDTSTGSHQNVLDTYACATGLTGPELAFPFRVPTDRNVNLSLSKSSVDFDLLVLEGTACVTTAKCAASAITAGVGNETLTLAAKANTDYLIVVDGRNGAKGSFTLNIGCEKLCDSKIELACNQTITGNTATPGTRTQVNLTACSSTPTPGPENSWKLNPPSKQDYKLKLTGLTQDLDLFVLTSDSNDCDGTCETSMVQSGTLDEELSFTGYPPTPTFPWGYQVVVDSKGAGGPYQLEVSCPVSCAGSAGDIDCSQQVVSGRSDDTSISSKVIDSWACAPNTTGAEAIYRFAPPNNGAYTFELTGLSENLDLIVVEGSSMACDPAAACVASSVKTGTADESVTFMADSTKTYYVAVDGKWGAASSFALKLKSAVCASTGCANSANTLSCAYREEVRASDSPVRSTSNVNDWTCDPGTGGPEVVYTFAPQTAGSYTVTVDGIATGQNLDLVVLEDSNGSSCNPTATCFAQSLNPSNQNESVTFTADPANQYYIAVDGKGTSSSSYHIKLASAACGAPVCANGHNSLSCTTRSVSSSNDASGATSDVSTWTCSGLPTTETGPEFAHKFTPAASGPYTIELVGLKADLDLLVLEADATGACAAGGTCVASSHASGNTAEKVTFNADVAKTYYVVVDGNAGAISNYTLTILDGCP